MKNGNSVFFGLEVEKYILKTKDFILNHASITQKYKDRIKKYYLSPEEIMDLIEKRDEKSLASIQ